MISRRQYLAGSWRSPATALWVLAAAILCGGCFYLGQEKFEDVVRTSPTRWSSRDCLTVILSAMVHNVSDNETHVECIATPFYPSVVMALNQLERTQYHWSEEDARFHMNELLRGSSGLYVDWKDGRFVNAKGNYFKDQTDIDSLLIVITLKNKTYPCAVPQASVVVKVNSGDAGASGYNSMAPLLPMADWPCYTTNITDIEQRIWLLNRDNDTLRPRYVWGRRNELFATTETLFAMFPLRRGGRNFLAGSSTAWLEISGFDTKIKYALETMKMQ